MARTAWLPTVNQILMANERPILAALDTALEMVTRTLMAEHPMMEEDASRGPAEPLPPCQALAASMVILARTMQELIDSYLAALEHIHGDRADDECDPTT
jgi:hypothetical protein